MKMIHSLGILRAALAVAFLLTGYALPAAAKGHPERHEWFGGHKVAANEVIVKFRSNAAATAKSQVEQDEDVESSETLGDGKMTLFRSRTRNVDTLVRNLANRGDIEYAEPNYLLNTQATPNDTSFYSEWAMLNTGQTVNNRAGVAGADISATLAWDITTGSTSNVVGVVDTGVDYNHPDLALNIWSAPQAFTVTIGGATITCPAGSHGFNAITNTCNPLDDNNHGTHTSGTIGAVGNDAYNIAGINWTASIMGLKFLDAAGSGTTSNAINAIEFAIQARQALGGGANVRILSNSWGGTGFSQAMLDVINKANQNGMLFVAAAGNSSSNNDTALFYPANYAAPNVISVAATDSTDSLATFSNYGATTVHLGAPGVNIISTVRNGGYAYGSGTSMATPHVAGTAALMLAANSNLTTDQLKAAILGGVDPISSLTAKTLTGGRLNAYNAVVAAQNPAPVPSFSLSATPPSATVSGNWGGKATYGISITAIDGFSGNVSLSVSGLPYKATAVFSPNPAAAASTMTVQVPRGTKRKSYPLTIIGKSGTLTRTTTVTLVVQ